MPIKESSYPPIGTELYGWVLDAVVDAGGWKRYIFIRGNVETVIPIADCEAGERGEILNEILGRLPDEDE